MDKIFPHFWYDKEAMEAVMFYINIFDDSEIQNATTLENTPSGDAELISFKLGNQEFNAISAGPFFKFNVSMSLMVKCYSKEEIFKKWEYFKKDGTVLIPLEKSPIANLYGWIQDKYGLSWQFVLVEEESDAPKITCNFMFSDKDSKIAEAMEYYRNIFIGPDKSVLNYFQLQNSELPENGNFNESISLIINCRTQEEIDYFWEKLSSDPEAEQCGWLKDRFGISWQIVPEILGELLNTSDKEVIERVTSAFLSMKKFDIEELKRAYNGL